MYKFTITDKVRNDDDKKKESGVVGVDILMSLIWIYWDGMEMRREWRLKNDKWRWIR